MKILVVTAHPNPKDSRVNKRWLEELDKHDITISNLNEKYPDEIIDKEAEQALLLEHDRIVFQYPWYWYNMPPLLRKWQDIVLEYGFAFGPGGTMLSGKDYVVAISVGGPEVSYQAGGYNTYTISEFLKPMQQTANLTGMNFLPAFKIHSAVVISDEDLEASAVAYAKHIIDPELDPQVELKRILSEMQETGNEL